MIGKKVFLQKLTSQTKFKSLELKSTNFEGSSPPSVFIGRANYPKVYAGPMLSEEIDSGIYDAPERWLGSFGKNEIIDFRLNLVRGKKLVDVKNVSGKFAQQMQDIALAKDSLYTHAEFKKVPKGVTFSEDHQPFGPSGQIEKVETETPKWQKHMSKAHYDTDLLSKDAVVNLHEKGLEFTAIQSITFINSILIDNLIQPYIIESILP